MKPSQRITLATICVTVLAQIVLCDVSQTFYDNCSKTKGCFGIDKNCVEEKNCTLAVSYQGISEDKYTFQIIGKSTSDKKYVATGLSPGGSMGDSSVVACFIFNNQPIVQMNWNDGYDSFPLDDKGLGLSSTSISVEDGFMLCQFTRESVTEFETPTRPPKNVTFDLNNNKYTLLIATGPLTQMGQLDYHGDGKMFSDVPLILSEYNPFYVPPIYSGCGKDKGCVGSPKGCIDAKNCSILTTYVGVSENQYKFELLGKADNAASSYIAVGLSPTGSMSGTSVMACSVFKDQTRVEMYWNEGYNSRPLSNTSFGLSNIQAKYSDGYLQCSFYRESFTNISTSTDPSKNEEFDINRIPYYVLLARGPLTNSGLVTKHTEKMADDAPENLMDYNQYFTNFYNGCGTKKGCFGTPKGCIDAKNCNILTTYTGVSANQYKFELYGKADSDTSSYIAVGLSPTGNMSGSSVMACSVFKDQTRVEMYWNEGYNSSRPLSNTSFGLSNIQAKYSDGYLQCSFYRESFTNILTPTDPSTNQEFNLNSTPYYLLVARGPLNSQGLLVKHTEKYKSESLENIFDYNPFLKDDTYTGCGVSKGCFGFPENCVNGKNCKLIATYVKQDNGDINFHLSGSVSDNSYLALGLANGDKMYDASVMFCYTFNNDHNVAMSWNAPKGRDSYILADPTLGLKDQNVLYEDGKLSCSFTREKITNITVPNEDRTVVIDLSKQYYLLLGKGPLSQSRQNSDLEFKMGNHGSGDRAFTDKPVDLSKFGIPEGSKNSIVRWHGSLMVVAWIFLACTGTMTARYGKKMNKKVLGKDIWFRIHQVCMGSTWALSLASLILMWYEKGIEPLSWESVQNNGHAAVGMAAFVLAFIQPFMAFLRPHPDSSKRWIFNIAHQSVGLSAILLSFVAIGLATKFESFQLEDGRYLLGAFCAFYAIFHIFLTFYTVKINESGKGVPVFLSLFAVGAIATTIVMIVFIADNESG